MSAFLAQVILIVIINITGIAGQSSIDWKTLWAVMTSSDEHWSNYKSTCPWEYVIDTETNEIKTQLLPFVKHNCLDFSKSNENGFATDPHGQCAAVYANCGSGTPTIVGFTCQHAMDRPAVIVAGKRNFHIEPQESAFSKTDSKEKGADSEFVKPIVPYVSVPKQTKERKESKETESETEEANEIDTKDDESTPDNDHGELSDLKDGLTNKHLIHAHEYVMPDIFKNAELLKLLTKKIVKRWMKSRDK
ncbi:hypothetical protein ACF0H5_017250 [Mactra antiquata]